MTDTRCIGITRPELITFGNGNPHGISILSRFSAQRSKRSGRMPPEQLAADILEKERRIAEIMVGIQGLLKNMREEHS